MSWFAGKSLTWMQQFVVDVIKCGKIPQHVAFVMDGNRRYARNKNMETSSGHFQGLETLKWLAYWCKQIGIPEITVYAFSIDNFKRELQEVISLMDLSRSEFSQLVQEYDDFMKDGMRMRFFGNLDLLPEDIRKLVAKMTFMTSSNKDIILNLAYSYTSREEITNAISCVVKGVKSGILQTEDIDEELLSKCMYTNQCKDPEIIIRTSGETRFSDFLLWQAQFTQVYVEEVMWPEFTIWNLLKIIFLYQTTDHKNQTKKLEFQAEEETNPRIKKFLKKLEYTRKRHLQTFLAYSNNNS